MQKQTDRSKVENNTAIEFSGGGVAVGGHGIVAITGASEVAFNRVINDSGGGVTVADNAHYTLSSSNISHNRATDSGVSIHVAGDATAFIMNHAVIEGNDAKDIYGAALAVTGGYVNISNGVWFIHNMPSNDKEKQEGFVAMNISLTRNE